MKKTRILIKQKRLFRKDKILLKEQNKMLSINFDEIGRFLDENFQDVAIIWDEFSIEKRRGILLLFAEEGIMKKEDAIAIANLRWKRLPAEIKLLIVSLEYGDL